MGPTKKQMDRTKKTMKKTKHYKCENCQKIKPKKEVIEYQNSKYTERICKDCYEEQKGGISLKDKQEMLKEAIAIMAAMIVALIIVTTLLATK